MSRALENRAQIADHPDQMPIIWTLRNTLQPERGVAETAQFGGKWDLPAIEDCLQMGDNRVDFFASGRKAKPRNRHLTHTGHSASTA